MTVDAIEKKFWQGLRAGVSVFVYLANEEYLTSPLQACAEGERLPLWLLAPSDSPLLRRLHRNDNGVATVALEEFGLFARISGKMRPVEDAFSVQRVGRIATLPWSPALLANSVLLRLDLSQATFWQAGSGAALEAKLDISRKPAVSASIVPISAAVLRGS